MHAGHKVIPLYDSGCSVGSRHSTHSAYGGPSASGGPVVSIRQWSVSVPVPVSASVSVMPPA